MKKQTKKQSALLEQLLESAANRLKTDSKADHALAEYLSKSLGKKITRRHVHRWFCFESGKEERQEPGFAVGWLIRRWGEGLEKIPAKELIQ